uniref:Galectin n=1 Tax=Electrophorus electricus TaxID=8005 RepID=A0AAY5ED08_ELEEL
VPQVPMSVASHRTVTFWNIHRCLNSNTFSFKLQIIVCCRFVIDLKTGTKDDGNIAFHFSACMSHVCCDTFRNRAWEKQYNTAWSPFAKGAAFDMFMVIKQEGYEVIVNGQMFCMFNHRMPLESVSRLTIWGDNKLKMKR